MTVLADLADALASGTVDVVDLTQPLGPETQVIGLPPIFAASPGVTIDVISKYDDRGPAWYWNTLRFGEHTGTHFDAPIHWVTGKDLPDNACDTIPARRFVGPACVIDATDDAARNADLLVTVARIEAWEREHGRIPAGAWVLLRTGWSRRTGAAFQNVGADGPHTPGFEAAASRFLAHDRDVRRRDDRHRRGPGGHVRSAVSEPHDHARRRQVRPREPLQPRSAAADGRDRDRRAAQDRQRQRQPAAGDCVSRIAVMRNADCGVQSDCGMRLAD